MEQKIIDVVYSLQLHFYYASITAKLLYLLCILLELINKINKIINNLSNNFCTYMRLGSVSETKKQHAVVSWSHFTEFDSCNSVKFLGK